MFWSFNNAVVDFGNYIESKLREKDKKGKPRHTLKKLLGVRITKPRRVSSSQLAASFAARGSAITHIPAGGSDAVQ